MSNSGMPSCDHNRLVCPAIRWAEEEIKRLRDGIHRYLSGDWMQRPPSKLDKCPHGHFGWEACEACIDSYFVELLGPEP